MKCPKCGYVRQSRDNVFAPPTECPACGVVYAKYLTNEVSTTLNPLDGVIGPKRSSPVHEESLKQARERVERRLRKKFDPREKDEFREQTLQRARLFVTEGIRKRREEMEQRKAESEKAAAAPEPGDDDQGAISRLESSPDQQIPDVEPHMLDDAELIHVDDRTEYTAHLMSAPPQSEADQPVTNDSRESQTVATQEEKTMSIEASGENPDEGSERAFTIGEAEPVEPEEDQVRFTGSDGESVKSEQPAAEVFSAAMLEAGAPSSGRIALKNARGGMMRLLPAVAWMILVAGVIGAVLSWTTLGDVQAGIGYGLPSSGNRLPVALLLGFAYLATGVLGFAFFWVSSMINSQIKEIRHLLLEPLSRKGQ